MAWLHRRGAGGWVAPGGSGSNLRAFELAGRCCAQQSAGWQTVPAWAGPFGKSLGVAGGIRRSVIGAAHHQLGRPRGSGPRFERRTMRLRSKTLESSAGRPFGSCGVGNLQQGVVLAFAMALVSANLAGHGAFSPAATACGSGWNRCLDAQRHLEGFALKRIRVGGLGPEKPPCLRGGTPAPKQVGYRAHASCSSTRGGECGGFGRARGIRRGGRWCGSCGGLALAATAGSRPRRRRHRQMQERRGDEESADMVVAIRPQAGFAAADGENNPHHPRFPCRGSRGDFCREWQHLRDLPLRSSPPLAKTYAGLDTLAYR